jgi:heterodisulfide reductase subunit A
MSKKQGKKATKGKKAAEVSKESKGRKVGKAGKGAKADAGPRIGVFVCNCGTNIAGFLECKSVAEYAGKLPGVVFVRENLYSCSEAGVNDIKQAIISNKLDRVVVAACTPRTHEPTFRAACEDAGLNAYHFEFVNIREHCSWVHKEEQEIGTQKAKDLIRMGVARAAHLEPMVPIVGEVTERAVIVGGGISGMTAALELAARGFRVVLIERRKELGGLVGSLHTIYPSGRKADEYVGGIARRVEKNRKIEVIKASEVTDVRGFVGKYEVQVSSRKEPIVAGIIILATGARPLLPEGMYGHDSKKVITMLELEAKLKRPKLGHKNVVMLGCAGARVPERVYCSRICCMTAIKNSIILRKQHKAEVTVLYRDLMCYGVRNEEILAEAKKAGVRFVNYSLDSPPVIEKGKITVSSDILGRDIEVPVDLLVLATPLVPQDTNAALSRILKVPVDEYGFFLEAHVKLRPLDFATDGIFVCGTARWPASVQECIEQSIGAASRASTYLARGEVAVEPIVSVITAEDCRGCGLCVALCPYGAIELVETEDGKKARTIEVACKGCGTCGATCYRHAIKMKHYSDEQLTAQIRAAFAGE